MVAIPADQFAQVRVVLREIVAEHGRSALSDPARMSNLLKDLMPDALGVARMLVAAAEDRVADELREHAANGLDGPTAGRLVTTSFAGRTLFAPEACAFIVGQIALALGIASDAGYAPTVVTSSGEPPGPASRSTVDGDRSPVAPPRLALGSETVEFGQIAQYGRSPERHVRIGNAGGGSLNAWAATSAGWIVLRQVGDELVITVDTRVAGQYQDAVTIESDGGSATIGIRATIQPEKLADPDHAAAAASSSGAVNLRVVGDQPPPREQPGEQEHWPWPWAPKAKGRTARPT